MKYLGIDYGEKKVGLAIGDLETRIASPYKILINNKGLLEKIKDICVKEEISKIVVGLPLTLKSSTSKQTRSVLNFIEKLKKATYLEIIEQDERLSSVYAKSLLKEMKVKHMDDDVAAMIILQSYLDEM
ncbi:MAG TPA: Holliday junction resolvase RuvX [Candidatus Uhrbacteria bacterium]|nr:Holliday junction resolvase RuvX [Candidatus Uhrbacteria bacterium]